MNMKIFTLETLIKDLIDFSNKTFLNFIMKIVKKCEKENE